MLHAYLLSEDDSDDAIYLYVLEVLLRSHVEIIPTRLRRGGGVGEVRKKLPLLLATLRRTGPVDGAFFVVAIDNDRAAEHPDHKPRAHTTNEACRHCGLMDTIAAALPDGQAIPGVIAVPVQAIEAWLLLMHDGARFQDESVLPAHSRRDQPAARAHLGADPPAQLKDLVREARRTLSEDGDFALHCVLRLDPDDLARRSPSFARFRRQVAALSLIPAP